MPLLDPCHTQDEGVAGEAEEAAPLRERCCWCGKNAPRLPWMGGSRGAWSVCAACGEADSIPAD